VTSTSLRLSILDLASLHREQHLSGIYADSVALARRAEELGYQRVWYGEHHNIPGMASSAISVIVAHVGAKTSTIRLGSGGVMLPNYAPLTVAEQFGTLDAMYPGRIDLGLGRAPGGDQRAMQALRRGLPSADTYPGDVAELRGYLSGHSRVPGVDAVPGNGSNVPLYILGSSTFGARLAASLGLPFAFASHFAPDALKAAVSAYRQGFQPSEQLERPYVMAGLNVMVADTHQAASAQLQALRRRRAGYFFGKQLDSRGPSSDCEIDDDDVDRLLATDVAAGQVDRMLTYAAVGTPGEVRDYLDGFARSIGADELITEHHAPTIEERLRSITLLAEAIPPAAA
jgi:luciferase family oxidoreductase group 1